MTKQIYGKKKVEVEMAAIVPNFVDENAIETILASLTDEFAVANVTEQVQELST
jgi:hypothetical protein